MTLGIVGVTGAVGLTALRVLHERGWQGGELRLFASSRSEGQELPFGDERLRVAELDAEALAGCDVALFALDDPLAREWVPQGRARGVTIVDNSAVYRMDPDVPLVVPEVNGHLLEDRPKLVANPNCSTIALVVALAPIAAAAGVRRLHAVSFQSASGAGLAAIDELRQGSERRLARRPDPASVFPKPLAFNCLPQIGAIGTDGISREERKMLGETRRILGREALQASFTCVRVPTFVSHALAVHVETEASITPRAAMQLWKGSPGVTVGDGRDPEAWPTPRDAEGRDDVLVGRVREDPCGENGLLFWVVSDNLRKGAATNAIQIAESLLER